MNRYRIILWAYRFAKFSRFLSRMISHWPLFVLVALILSPMSPHVWMGDKQCSYLGVRGIVSAPHLSQCHWLVILDTRTQEGL